jgi:hypothetical protein
MKNNACMILILFLLVSCSQKKEPGQNRPGYKIQFKTDERILILANSTDWPVTPGDISRNIDYIESLPFEGMFVMSSASDHVMNDTLLDHAKISEDLAPLKGAFKKFNSNFIYVMSGNPGDLWDDKSWETAAANFAIMAKVAKETGFKGIVYDSNVTKDPKWQNFGDGGYVNPAYDLNQHRDMAVTRGKQVMEAMIAEYPGIEVICLDGPYLSEPNYRTPGIIMGQAATWDNYELVGPFFIGLLEGKGDSATVVDGGRLFQYRTASNFRRSYMVRKYEIASEETDSWFIPYKLRLAWPNHVNVAFGVYDQPWKPEFPMNIDTMRNTLRNALLRTDKYVWFSTGNENWLEKSSAPEDWKSMISETRSAL